MGITENDVDTICEKLKEKKWRPSSFSTEKLVENELYNFLHNTFPDENFKKQHQKGRGIADVYVNFKHAAEVIIEIKVNLNDPSEYLRLIGQIYEYHISMNCELLVLLCGETEPSLKKSVKTAVEYFNDLIGTKKLRFLEIT